MQEKGHVGKKTDMKRKNGWIKEGIELCCSKW